MPDLPRKLAEENARLQRRVLELQAEQRELAARLSEVESHAQLLQSLFVTSYRLHAAADIPELLATLDEILTNVVGAKQFGLWSTSASGEPGELKLQHGFAASVRDLTPTERTIARVAVAGGAWFNDDAAQPDEPIAVVPLRARTTIVGVLVIRKFLDHKRALGKIDRQVLGLLAEQVGTSLAGLQPRWRRAKGS